jgi:sugar lactone lactonase YvrE
LKSEIIFKSGEFAYRFINDWGKLPDEIGGSVVRGIVQGTDGFFYVAVDAKDYSIAVLDYDGNFIKGICHDLKTKLIHGLSVDNDGTIRFCDVHTNVIYHIDSDGNILNTIGVPYGFSESGYNYSVDLQKSLNSIIRAAPPFNRPTRMIKTRNGGFYVSDGYGNAAVHRFDSEGKHQKTWGGPGIKPGEFRLPHSIWEDSLGDIWVADRENSRVQVFDCEGNLLNMFEQLHAPSDIWGDSKHIYVSENRAGLVIFEIKSKRTVARIGYKSVDFNGCPIGSHSLCGDKESNIYLGEIKSDNPLMKLERI